MKMDPNRLRAGREELRRIWVDQLHREYDHVCWSCDVPLRRPLIHVAELTSKWATWNGQTRTITVNTKLIESYSWDTVIEILKHEMAHQLVADSRGDHRPHGAEFVEACRRLRVADWAVRASGELVDLDTARVDRALAPEEERLLRRVEKLLSLATSSNEHEALLAMQRVQEIHARFDIARLQAQRQAEFEVRVIDLRKQRVDRLVSMTCSILAEHFFVRVIYGNCFDAADLREYRNVELIGTRANVSMAEFVYHFLGTQLDALWTAYRKRTKARPGARRDYMLGVLVGFRDKLAAGRSEVLRAAAGDLAEDRAHALVALGRTEVDRFVEDRYPRLVRRSWSTGFQDVESYEAGVVEGQRIVIARPLDQQGSEGGLLPPGRAGSERTR